MVAALLRMPALPGPGELLSLGPNVVFQFQPDFSALYVRECYPRLFDALVCDEKPTKYIVTGTPGIGKSWFATYLILRLLKRSSPPPFILWEHFMYPGEAWCYVHETGQVVVGQRSSFRQLLDNPATWYIVDGAPPLFDILARTVLLTSPKRETYKELRKHGAALLYMPLWELDELQACRRLMYSTVDESLTTALHQHYGGVARFALGLPWTNPGKGLHKLLEELRTAVDGCNTAQMRSSIGAISSGPEVSHRLLHIVANKKTCEMQYLKFASKWVAEEFAKKAVRNELQGGCFTAVPISYNVKKSTFIRGVEEKLQFDPCTEQEFFEAVPSSPTEQIYYRPSSARFPTVDALRRGNGTCDFFQMTVQNSKRLDTDTLGRAIDQVKLKAEEVPRLHFVVPAERYAKFKLTGGRTWVPSSQTASRVKLYIMKGVHAQLKAAASCGFERAHYMWHGRCAGRLTGEKGGAAAFDCRVGLFDPANTEAAKAKSGETRTKCFCGYCATCKNRIRVQQYRARKKAKNTEL
ncbi:hypothetical protein VOLCADRAFT_94291 [Volvox carteri f. nagariensis]|uniref:Uncharacterized protein n=1 Tax=Volvox carteri f. nagariensis TaxID=3068 RepID=D8U440_VOLCA|nr:uncharacterized protein VOLCADRAFT_94291 [Volvox carteri f. nagariensis]EFJ45432.1 hypothetical protein VOLCADRAFT_94291 [Volvox carteri f. nagariensis]|eukprot:XP_002953459.1 hypothetical protein VOLCADRAFT_94291 [Volvox carteri f. nagariensis]